MKREQEWDDLGRMQSLKYLSVSGSALESMAWEYDAEGNRISERTLQGQTTYTCNARNELVAVLYPNGEREEFTYDLAGNKTGIYRGGVHQTLTYAPDNRLISAGDYIYTFDQNGSLISRQHLMNSTATQFAYDDSNKLVSVNQSSGLSASYTWLAGTDLRVSSSSSSGPTSYFVYDGVNETDPPIPYPSKNPDHCYEYDCQQSSKVHHP